MPQIDDWGNYVINAELGIETSISKSVNLRAYLQDTYRSEPATWRRRKRPQTGRGHPIQILKRLKLLKQQPREGNALFLSRFLFQDPKRLVSARKAGHPGQFFKRAPGAIRGGPPGSGSSPGFP